ncbi:MAG: hypothetical protein ACTHM6_14425 [Tepidisphaeraceae bacterium]
MSMTLFTLNGPLPPRFRTFGNRAFVAGAAAWVLLLLLAIFWPHAVARSYLFAYTFWLNTALGCLGMLLLLHASGGAWARTARRICEAGSLTLPALAVLGIPLLILAPQIVPWADARIWAHDPIQASRRPWFNADIIYLRTAITFVIWIAFAWWLRRLSIAQDRAPTPDDALHLSHRLRLIGRGGLVMLFLTVSLVGVDWIMSREPHWVSTIFGMVILMGEALTANLWIVLVLYALNHERASTPITTPERVHDLGKLLLMNLVLWAYVMFSQYLIQWLGNTQTDIPWFVHRTRHGWQWVGAALIFLHLLIPLFLLLSARLKRQLGTLALIAAGIWCMRWVDTLWLVAPSTYTGAPAGVYPTDLLAPIALGGLWIGLFLRSLDQQPLFPAAYPTSGANRTALVVKGAANVD